MEFSFRFPLQAWETEPLRGSPREAGGNLKEGGKIGTFEHPLTPLDMPPR